MDLSRYSLAFSDEFNDLKFAGGADGGWKTTYHWGDRRLGDEKQLYVDTGFGDYNLNPFSVQDGILTIRADPASDEFAAETGYKYTSGLLNSESLFSTQYGYFEIRAEMPAGKGLWPAFWLLESDGGWPAEYDVVEVLGHDTDRLYATSHYVGADGKNKMDHKPVDNLFDSADGFHTYGFDWQADRITWYYDGQEVFSAPNRVDDQSMYMLINLAVGGSWPGSPDASTPFPAEMKVDYVRVYRENVDHAVVGMPEGWAAIGADAFVMLDGTGAYKTYDYGTRMREDLVKLKMEGTWARYAKGNALDNYIEGNNGIYNEMYGYGGNDVLKGNKGFDLFIVGDGDGNDRFLDFSNAPGDTDKVRLEGFHFTHFDDLRPFMTETAEGVILRLDGDQALLFDDLRIADLSAEQFIFTDSVAASAEMPPLGPPSPPPPLPPPPVTVRYVRDTTVLAADDPIKRVAVHDPASTTPIDLSGNAGSQILVGNAGTNILDGKGGGDTLIGLGGGDRYLVRSTTDRVVEALGRGFDVVLADASFSLAAGQEIEVLEARDPWAALGLRLKGNEFAQTITGDSGTNILIGQGGDALHGKGGNDTYVIAGADDEVFEHVGGGVDIVVTGDDYRLAAGQDIEVLRLCKPASSAGRVLVGNERNQTILGGAEADVLFGGGGTDRLLGKEGADTFIIDTSVKSVTVLDFDEEDAVTMAGLYEDFAALARSARMVGDHLRLDVSGVSIVFANTSLDELESRVDFVARSDAAFLL